MEEERLPEQDINGKLHNTSPMAKARTKRDDVVQRHTSQILGKRRLRRGAEE